VTSEQQGIAVDGFHAAAVPASRDMITWTIRDRGFDMVLSGEVPAAIEKSLRHAAPDILDGAAIGAIDLWAIHPGGRTVLDAVERAFDLPPAKLAASREVLRRYGNMSSATVMFVLEMLMRRARPGATGCAMAFGPGMVAETMRFHAVASNLRVERPLREPVEAF
jgi:predicted naringenin-chalcone synthase